MALQWIPKILGGHEYSVMNLDYPEVTNRVLAEMDSGIPVYYDTRWETTEKFSEWLNKNNHLIAGREILAIGAGVGYENLLLARSAKMLHLNDFSPVSVELCAEQLEHNGFTNYSKLSGDFTKVPFPESVEVAVGCFIVYNSTTNDAMMKFLERFPGEVILVNERLRSFRRFLEHCPRSFEVVFEDGPAVVLRISNID